MIKFRQILLAASMVSAVILSGCSPKVFTAKYTKVPELQLATNVQPSQTIGNITVEMKPLDLQKEYEKTLYKQKINVTYTPTLSTTPVTEYVETPIQIFYNLAPFSVTITNNTDHILRMKDSRIIFVDPKLDEPVMGLNKENPETYQNMKSIFPIMDYTISIYQAKYPQTSSASLYSDLLVGITNILQQIKFINGFNMEIMPGMKTSGILLFPVNPAKISEGKISFIDMISKTDAAGNATEKVRFDYKTNLFYHFYKMDPNVNNWVEIKEDDYNNGQSRPEVYTYDKTQKKWVLSTPQK